jgi:hypothetical protein
MADDWRIRIDVEEEERAQGLLDRLGGELDSEARELAGELEARRLVVSRDGETVFVYAATRAEAERAHAVVEAELRSHGIEARTSTVEHWLDDEDRWDDEPPVETWEEEELAERLEGEGYRPERRFHYLVVGAESREAADELATRLHGEVEPGGELVWEANVANPFAIFGGLGL